MKTLIWTLVLSAVSSVAWAADAVTVTPENFTRAETDLYFAKTVAEGALGKFVHNRDATPIDKQVIIRMNRDTLYSSAVFDLDAGPVTLALPDSGDRFMSAQVLDEDQYTVDVFYGSEPHSYTKEKVGTRYLFAIVRTLVNPEATGDLDEVHKLQDAIKSEQPGGPGSFQVPDWDPASHKKVRDILLELSATMPDFDRAFGSRGEVDPIKFLVGSAAGWGGNPDTAARYVSFVPKENDGKTIYKLHVPADVPVDGFWSISRYDAKGFFAKNEYNAYSLNNLTARKGADGSVDVQFGGCDGKIPNCLPIDPGWNYTVRLYRPRAALLDGRWTFPEAVPAR